MRTSDQVDAVFGALISAQRQFRPVEKTSRNQQQGFSYATLEDYLRAVRDVLAEHRLALCGGVAEVLSGGTMKTKNGEWPITRVCVVLRLIHDSGQWIEVEAWGDGADSGDKGVYKATTGARKYAVASLLGLATLDDPEKGKAPKQSRNAATDDQLAELRALAADARLPEAWREAIAKMLSGPVGEERARATIERAKARTGEAQ